MTGVHHTLATRTLLLVCQEGCEKECVERRWPWATGLIRMQQGHSRSARQEVLREGFEGCRGGRDDGGGGGGGGEGGTREGQMPRTVVAAVMVGRSRGAGMAVRAPSSVGRRKRKRAARGSSRGRSQPPAASR